MARFSGRYYKPGQLNSKYNLLHVTLVEYAGENELTQEQIADYHERYEQASKELYDPRWPRMYHIFWEMELDYYNLRRRRPSLEYYAIFRLAVFTESPDNTDNIDYIKSYYLEEIVYK